MGWSNLTQWWLAELASDPAYEDVVTPLLFEVFHPLSNETYLDLGCGEGREVRRVEGLGAKVIGLDVSPQLASMAGLAAVSRLPQLPIRSNSVDGAYSVLTLEHIVDQKTFFSETARVVRAGGQLSIVINHPIWTAPGSTPITDDDGEVLFRPGDYFGGGFTDEPAESSLVRFHHRSVADLVTSAAASGWALEAMVERPHHDLPEQGGIPRLLAARWRRSPQTL